MAVNRGFAASVLAVLAAPSAVAAPVHPGAFALPPAPPVHQRTLNFRLVEDRVADPGPVHHSGMIAHTQLLPNASIGVGLLKASPKRLSGEWRQEPGAPRSRKAAVTFVMKF